jgi:hypothetical protein
LIEFFQAAEKGYKTADRFRTAVTQHGKVVRDASVKALSLFQRDLLATRVYAVVTEAFAYVHMHGDGVIAWKDTSEKITMIRYDWAENTPCYPSYDHDNYKSFLEVQSKCEEQGLTEETISWTKENGFSEKSTRVISINDGLGGMVRSWKQCELPELSLIMVMSDGVTRVEGVPWNEVVLESFQFKNLTGQFLKRRYIRMFKEWSKEGITPLDDIACAVIHLDHSTGESNDDS